jgi:hypothetical protein
VKRDTRPKSGLAHIGPMSMAMRIWMALFVVAFVAAAHLTRVSVTPTSNAAFLYVTDRWTGDVYGCSYRGPCSRVPSP